MNPPGGANLAVLLLTNGMTAPSLHEGINELKSASKNCGTHKRREFYWQAYGKMMGALSGHDGPLHGFLQYYTPASEDDEGIVEFTEFTGKQRQMLASTKAGCLEILGKKFKPPEDPTAKEWFMCWFDEEAQHALEDITEAEPAIYVTVEGVFIGTKLKRKMCKAGSTYKTAKDLEKAINELEPDKPLQSVAWRGHHPPVVNEYNVIVAGGGWGAAVVGGLPPCLGYTEATSPMDIYGVFLQRRNAFLISQADRMIEQMLVDVQKGEKALIVSGGMKEAAAARENSLMKKVFVHASKGKFVQKMNEEGGDVEMIVIKGDIEGTLFGDHGGIVFEMFYRADLDMFL